MLVINPIYGIFLDKFQKYNESILLAAFLFIIEFLLYALLNREINGWFIIIPLVFTAIASMLSIPTTNAILAKKSPQNFRTIIFSLSRLISSLWFEFFVMIFAIIHDNTISTNKGYFWSNIMLAICEIIVSIGLIILIIYNNRKEKQREINEL